MATSLSFLTYLQKEKIKFWQAIAKAVDDELIFIDEENDLITVSNYFLISYPYLHEVMNMLVEMWIDEKFLNQKRMQG